MIKPLLIEIAVEELPAIPFLKELPNIEQKWLDILEENSLKCEFNFYYTPRRLVFWHREFPIAQEDKIVEQFGAPVSIAYKDGQPTGAAMGFAKKCGVEVEALETIETSKGEVLYYKQEVKGENSINLLEKMVNDFIASLNFGKSMRWADRKDSFIRPIRGLSIVLGEDLVEASLFGVKSSMTSFSHRMVSYEPFSFSFAGDYFCKLDKHGVILYPAERKKLILEQMEKLQKENDIKIEIDEELLDEVVAITEYPTALIGTFDEEFLVLPDEVIVNSMKEHQRYFAVYKDGKITNKFIVVSNAYTTDFSHIIAGNEKVLRPRLSDAMFFWNNDLKNGLSNERLRSITFVEGLGSMYDKCEREAFVASQLSSLLDMSDDNELLNRAVMLSKADLVTDMVYEFTELQGLMGYYYAKAAGEDELLYTALKEQYLPDGEESDLPSNTFSSIVAMANKFDNILGLFSVGMIPTGSRDPYGLRRAAAGIIKICIVNKLPLSLDCIINNILNQYNKVEKGELMSFFFERLYQLYKDTNPSVIKSVLASGEMDISKLGQKIEALDVIVKSSDFKELSSTFKRVANIIKDIDTNKQLTIDVNLIQENAEKELNQAYNVVVSKVYTTYDEELDALFALKAPLDKFFDEVFVNHEDEAIKTNRKNIIGKVYQAFKTIADIKEITI